MVGWQNYYQWDNIGYWITRGIAEGMRGSAATSWIRNASQYVINMVRNEIRAATGEGSPATKFIPHGVFMIQGLAKGIVGATSVARDAVRSVVQDALDALSGELDTRSQYSEMESIEQRLGQGVRTGLEGALSAPVPLPPVASLPVRGAAVAPLSGGIGSRGFGPVSVTLNVDARGATREDAGAIGDELEGRMQKVLRDVLRGGGSMGLLWPVGWCDPIG